MFGCQLVTPDSRVTEGKISTSAGAQANLESYGLLGNVTPILDPSVIRQGDTYYVFSTDVVGVPSGSNLPIRCSGDQTNWRVCGAVFHGIPAWVRQKVPGVIGLWAPDVSFFNGLYHVYYTASMLYTQRSVIGLATNTTLDSSDPNYKWVDAGEVLESVPGDDFNALDPNILMDQSGSVWMTFGSYWSGIKQVQIDPPTGKPLPNATHSSLATRPDVPENPIEGASLMKHGDYYYLFLSVDYCCRASYLQDDYKEIVGRSTSPNGPFVDMSGTSLMQGGGTILLQAQGVWNAPGGGTAYMDSRTGDSLLVFHALKLTENGTQYLWLKHIDWQNDWPVLN
jgi:arabinan endo-1,5-alpha-L-arabinosidase